jgi:hypothetical protein
MLKSNLQIKSNLMIDDGKKKLIHYVPGYLLRNLHPSYKDSRVINTLGLSSQQLYEYEMTIMCLVCRRPCAGTCQKN